MQVKATYIRLKVVGPYGSYMHWAAPFYNWQGSRWAHCSNCLHMQQWHQYNPSMLAIYVFLLVSFISFELLLSIRL
jgi:hypothetical protein